MQDGCAGCDDRYGGFKTLEENWNKGEFTGLDGSFKLFTIYVDDTNDAGENLFENVYNRPDVQEMFEKAIEGLQDQDKHPYASNSSTSSSYASDLENLIIPDEITTPTTFLIDFTAKGQEHAKWTSKNGIREVLFSFEGTDGNDDYAKARTLRNAWTNEDNQNNVFSSKYRKA